MDEKTTFLLLGIVSAVTLLLLNGRALANHLRHNPTFANGGLLRTIVIWLAILVALGLGYKLFNP